VAMRKPAWFRGSGTPGMSENRIPCLPRCLPRILAASCDEDHGSGRHGLVV